MEFFKNKILGETEIDIFKNKRSYIRSITQINIAKEKLSATGADSV